jgi:hypothetical protein
VEIGTLILVACGIIGYIAVQMYRRAQFEEVFFLFPAKGKTDREHQYEKVIRPKMKSLAKDIRSAYEHQIKVSLTPEADDETRHGADQDVAQAKHKFGKARNAARACGYTIFEYYHYL